MPANQHPTTCFVCAYIAKREHSALVPPSEALQLCLLCNRNYCNEHRGEDEGVCENNNKTYWTRHHMDSPDIYPSLAARELAMKQRENQAKPEAIGNDSKRARAVSDSENEEAPGAAVDVQSTKRRKLAEGEITIDEPDDESDDESEYKSDSEWHDEGKDYDDAKVDEE